VLSISASILTAAISRTPQSGRQAGDKSSPQQQTPTLQAS